VNYDTSESGYKTNMTKISESEKCSLKKHTTLSTYPVSCADLIADLFYGICLEEFSYRLMLSDMLPDNWQRAVTLSNRFAEIFVNGVTDVFGEFGGIRFGVFYWLVRLSLDARRR